MIFIDSSSLIKKYFAEAGSEKIIKIMEKASQIVISPITYIEIINAIQRYYKTAVISKEHRDEIWKNIEFDFQYFTKITLNEILEYQCKCFLKEDNIHLKSLDLIQLTAAKYAQCNLFITSDEKLYQAASKQIKKTELIR